MTYLEATRHLAKGPYAPLYWIVGEDPYRTRQMIAQFRHVIPESARDFNEDCFWGADVNPEAVIRLAHTYPCMNPLRLIVIRDAEQIKQGEAFEDYIHKPCESTLMVWVTAKADLRKRPFPTLARCATVIRCAPLRDHELTKWIASCGHARGLSFSEEARYCIKTHLGNDLFAIDQVLERLALSDLPQPLSLSLVQQALSGGRPRTVFELIDHVCDRGMQRSLSCLYTLLDDGESPLGLLAMLLRQWRMMAIAKQALEQGQDESAAAEACGLPIFLKTPFFGRLKHFQYEEIRRGWQEMAWADSQLKGGGGLSAVLVLEVVITRLCGGRVFPFSREPVDASWSLF